MARLRGNNILDQEDMFAFQAGLGIVDQPYHPAGHLAVAVRAGNQKVYLDRPLDLTDEIAQENKAALEQAEHEQFTLRVRVGDFVG